MRVPQFKTIREMESFYYGDLNADLIRKAEAHTVTGTTAAYNKIYGAKVWSQLNYEANAFAVIPKEPWGSTGWRMENTAGTTAPNGGIAEGAATTFTAVPETTQPTNAYLYAGPKQIVHSWGASDFYSKLAPTNNDSIPEDYFRKQRGADHVRNIGKMLVQDVDTVAGNNFESIDRVISCRAESHTDYVGTASDPDIYGFDRSSAVTYDAYCSMGGTTDATLRDLTIPLIDQVWSNVTKQGGVPKVILTGNDTVRIWSALLESERRFNAMQIATFVPRSDGVEGTQPGVEGGFSVATYYNIPIIPTQHATASIASARTNEVPPIWFIDTDYVRLAVLAPTSYVESDEQSKFSIGFGKKGFYETWAELRCYNFAAQGKIRDIK